MPKAVSTALKDHLTGEVTTLCTVWQIVRKDGVQFFFTDHDRDLSYNGSTYIAAAGYQRTATASDASMSADNVEMVGSFDNDALVDSEMSSGLFDYATVLLAVVNWADLTQGAVKIRRGILGEVSSMPSGQFSVELRGLMQLLANNIGEVYTPDCKAYLGDHRCKFDISTIQTNESVTIVAGDNQTFNITKNSATYGGIDQAYQYGVVKWLTGLNAGRSMEVKNYVGANGAVQLFLSMEMPIAVGDTLTIVPGCDRTLATCISKFNNVVNFRGFPFLPGTDALLHVGTENI